MRYVFLQAGQIIAITPGYTITSPVVVIKGVGDLSGSELLSALNRLIDDTVTWADAVIWFNDAISELTEKLKIEAKQIITTTQGTLSYDIPADCLSIVKCDNQFETWAGEIIFKEDPGADSLNLYYYRKVNKLALVGDTPTDIPNNYHYALVLWAAMRYMQSEQELGMANEFERQFNDKKSKMINEIKNKVKRNTVKAVMYA